MSRFARLARFSDPLVIDVVDRPVPIPGPGEVLVRVHAAGLNPVDWKIAVDPGAAAHFGVGAPSGLGNDLAGVVEATGTDVTAFAPGDRVYGGLRGAAVAEHAVVAESALHATPDGLDDEHAAVLQIAARTADATIGVARPARGETVLIGGAAGGVGVFAVQLAVAAGATVIATASVRNHDFLRSLGALPTTYGDGLVERVRAIAPSGVDAAIDLQGIETVEAALELGVPPERIATIAAGPTPPGGATATGGADSTDAALERIAAEVAAGRIVVPIEKTFPIDRVADAFSELREGHVRGKLVVTIPAS